MSSPKRNRARILTASGLKKLREQMRSHEVDENAGFKYTLERLGELTGLDPETVKNVLDCKGSDKRTIARCFETFGLTLAESDHVPAAQATTTADPNFVGRDEAIADLDTLVSRNARVIVIQARGGVGKTTLARKYLQQEFDSFLEFPIAKETKDIASIEGLLEEKLRQLGEEPGREFLVSLDRLKRKLQAERLGILIDNLEPALDSAGKFIEAHRRYVELLRVLSDPTVQSLTLITSRERLREADVTVQHYSLRSLDVQAWEQFFQSRGINTETSALTALHDAYGGNAKAMDIISGAVLEDFSGGVEAYWQANQDDLFIERDLEDLVTKQFDRLQQLDPDAYNLLCRMGCYRYQDVPTVPIEGLFCLLWDVPENRHRRVIKSLQDRSLIDFEDREFWLHPVVREDAISLFRESAEWKIANRKIAEFWTETTEEINTIEEALKAFEAYYHYLQINEFDEAGNVIVKRRINKYDSNICLGDSFWRMGLLQQILISANHIVDSVSSKIVLADIYIIIGNAYEILGNIQKGIECQNKAQELSENYIKEASQGDGNLARAKSIRIYSIISVGAYMIDLWELQEASDLFYQAISLSEEYCFTRPIKKALFCLAYIKSVLGFQEEAFELADRLYEETFKENRVDFSAFYINFLALTYRNLGDNKKAFSLYFWIISNLEKINYSQGKARALYGIADLYREENNIDEALRLNLESINLLDQINAKFDLALAYYYFGLTHGKIDNFKESDLCFQKSIHIFSELGAPKQVERVRQSMQDSNGG